MLVLVAQDALQGQSQGIMQKVQASGYAAAAFCTPATAKTATCTRA